MTRDRIFYIALGICAAAGEDVCTLPADCASRRGSSYLQSVKAMKRSNSPPTRTTVDASELVAAEALFTGGQMQHAHGFRGGNRMAWHDYGPTYSKFLNRLLAKVDVPTIAEVGILTGSGMAMWQHLFPESAVYGFDLNTTTFVANKANLESLGFSAAHVLVTDLNEMDSNNTELLQSVFTEATVPNVVVDDALHTPEANLKLFLEFNAVLPHSFVYFVEDIRAGNASSIQDSMISHCSGCEYSLECSKHSATDECMIVMSRGLR